MARAVGGQRGAGYSYLKATTSPRRAARPASQMQKNRPTPAEARMLETAARSGNHSTTISSAIQSTATCGVETCAAACSVLSGRTLVLDCPYEDSPLSSDK